MEARSTDQPCINKREVHRIAQSISLPPLASRSLDYFSTDFRAIFHVGEEPDHGLEVELRVIVDLHQPPKVIGRHTLIHPHDGMRFLTLPPLLFSLLLVLVLLVDSAPAQVDSEERPPNGVKLDPDNFNELTSEGTWYVLGRYTPNVLAVLMFSPGL